MVRIYTSHDTSSSANTFSARIQSTDRNIDAIRKASFDFSKQSKFYDFYKDDKGTTWVLSYFGKSQDDAEYKLWVTHKTPSTADDAKYIVEKLNKSEAIELFETIVGRTNDEILNSFAKAVKFPKIVSIEKSKGPWKKGKKTGYKIGKEIGYHGREGKVVGQDKSFYHVNFSDTGEDEAIDKDELHGQNEDFDKSFLFMKSKGPWKKGKKPKKSTIERLKDAYKYLDKLHNKRSRELDRTNSVYVTQDIFRIHKEQKEISQQLAKLGVTYPVNETDKPKKVTIGEVQRILRENGTYDNYEINSKNIRYTVYDMQEKGETSSAKVARAIMDKLKQDSFSYLDFDKSFKPTRTTYNRQKIKGLEAQTLKRQGRDKKDEQSVQTTIKEGVVYDDDMEKTLFVKARTTGKQDLNEKSLLSAPIEKARKNGAKDKKKRKSEDKK